MQAALEARNLTRHAAHMRLEISRPAIEKLWNGHEVELDVVERFARGLGLDVNEWRELWGYPVVRSGAEILLAGVVELRKELNRPIPINWDEETLQNLTPEKAEQELGVLRRQAAEGLL